tara:strand:- start:800 stop:1033 length:234 start_codon:yes stop_codon:yes gene_type:complete
MTDKLELTEETDFILRIEDVRRAGHCPQGGRRWFEGMGYDFRDFLKNGKSAKELLETGDGLALQVVTRAWEHRSKGG